MSTTEADSLFAMFDPWFTELIARVNSGDDYDLGAIMQSVPLPDPKKIFDVLTVEEENAAQYTDPFEYYISFRLSLDTYYLYNAIYTLWFFIAMLAKNYGKLPPQPTFKDLTSDMIVSALAEGS